MLFKPKKINPVYWITIFLLSARPILAALPKWNIDALACYNSGACKLCDAFTLIQNIVDFLTTIIFPIAVAVIVYGAIMIMFAGDSPNRLQQGRHAIQTAVIGIIIVLLAWTGINILLQLLTGKPSLPWNTIYC